ncbi:MAG: CbiX/SirB N-terminal domain-containing protein [Fibrobacteria bacterium]
MKSLPVLILLGHGSRAGKTLEEMEELAAKLQASSNGLRVKFAFLTLLEPDLANAVSDAADAGAREIQVLPLFLFSGRHVMEDIPAIMEGLRSKHPGIALNLREAIGRHPDFFDFLRNAGGF